MLIESLIKPKAKPTRTVEVYGKTYEFKQPAGVQGRYVADVGDPKAVKALIATGAYAEYTDKLPASTLTARQPSEAERKAAEAAEAEAARNATLQAEAAAEAERAAAAAQAAEEEAQKNGGSAGGETSGDSPAIDGEVESAAKTLLAGTPQAIRKALKASENTPTAEVIAAAVTIEKRSLNPRVKVVEALTGALD